MTHIYQLSLDGNYSTSDIKEYLVNKGLVSHIKVLTYAEDIKEEGVLVYVPNKRKFTQYLRKKHRDISDPGYIVKSWIYVGEEGKSASSSKGGRLSTARIKKFKEAKKKKGK